MKKSSKKDIKSEKSFLRNPNQSNNFMHKKKGKNYKKKKKKKKKTFGQNRR